MKIYFVRRAESEGNANKYYQTPDTKLTAYGKNQAELLAKGMKDVEVDYIYSSTHLRAKETAKPISEDIENWERKRLIIPHLMESILVSNGKLARFLLFQSDLSKSQSNYYQMWDNSMHVNRLLDYFDQSGINHAILDLQIKEEGFQNKELEKLQIFRLDVS